MPGDIGGRVLLQCLKAPSKIGRRSAIHGLYHVVEWDPASRGRVVKGLEEVALSDPEPLLRQYAADMARDIAEMRPDHIDEPVFADEP